MRIFFITLFFLYSLKGFCQPPVPNAVLDFFKVNPFEHTMGSLINALDSDPDFIIDTIILRTDTSHFYLRGYYSHFNPFDSSISERTEIQIRDVFSTEDTVTVYQIIGLQKVNDKKALLKLAKKLSKKIYDGKYREVSFQSPKKSEKNYGWFNYYSKSSFPIYSLGWGYHYGSKQPTISVKLYFKIIK